MKPHVPRKLDIYPLHLEGREAYHEGLLAVRAGLVSPHLDGLTTIDIDDDALARGTLRIAVEGTFPSGLVLAGSMPPVERDLLPLIAPGMTAAIYLAVAKPAEGSNVRTEENSILSARYVAEGARGQRTLRAQVEILVEGEPLQRHESLRLGRARRHGISFELEPNVWPIIDRIQAYGPLHDGLRGLIAAVEARRDELVQRRVDHPFNWRSATAAEFTAADFLGTLHAHVHVLREIRDREFTTPRQLYEALITIYDELAEFGAADAVPTYEHDRLGEVFPPLLASIHRTVHAGVRDKTIIREFRREGEGYFRCTFPADLADAEPILVARGVDAQPLRQAIASRLMMASPGKLAEILQARIPGVGVEEDFDPPPSTPRGADAIALRIHEGDLRWVESARQGEVLLFFPYSREWPTLTFSLHFVKRRHDPTGAS